MKDILARWVRSFLYSPTHVRYEVCEVSMELCLRKLAKLASRPEGDLVIVGEPEKVSGLGVGVREFKYRIRSKGAGPYVFGEVVEKNRLRGEMRREVGYRHAFCGLLRVSTRCSGLCENGRCPSCGEVEEIRTEKR